MLTLPVDLHGFEQMMGKHTRLRIPPLALPALQHPA
jgi:hypothetical protein